MVTKEPTPLVAGSFVVVGETLDDGDNMDISFKNVNPVGFEIHTISHGGDCDVTLRLGDDGDFSAGQTITVDSFTGTGISQGNEIEIGDQDNMVLRITDTSGGTDNDYIVTGSKL